ncbi:hypothetical protein [Ferrovibrio sp.]|uniref:hypothetical protein n=1 Tax=Ferrovibrio sp. TaxID=1917215 RepID=UPI003919B0D7
MKSRVRTVALALAVLLASHQPTLSQSGVEEFRDPQNRLIGKIINRHDGQKEARSPANQLLGRYDPNTNETRSASNILFGRGNQLSALIYDAARQSTQRASSQATVSVDEQRHQDRLARLQSDQRRGVVLPETAARWARTTSAATGEDRRLAIEAFQRAGDGLGREQFWQNPSSGNSGSILLYPDQKANDTYYHGKLIPCFYGRMILNAGGETDVQRQLVCKLMHNGVWTTVQVETD